MRVVMLVLLVTLAGCDNGNDQVPVQVHGDVTVTINCEDRKQ